ncbi:BatD family protein [Cryomorphaceae bacterium]|nr:BatD family protein [Cryomorphaceae bacterium]
MSRVLHIGLILGMLISSAPFLNGQKLWAEVEVDKNSVYVGEPVQVSITVYTSTWFTRGIDLGNLRVENAFTVYFRPVSTTKTDAGNTYAGVQLIYKVFPYTQKDLLFPELNIQVESPEEGGYRGITQNVRSKAVRIRVKPAPATLESEDWLVTPGLRVSETYSKSLNDIRVGDVVERSVVRNADETVADLIPPISWDSVDGTRMYLQRPSVENIKGRTQFSARRTDRVQYLFEDEGEVDFPEQVLYWFHPSRQKLFKKTLPSHTVYVAANPDLGMLQTIRDSLSLMESTDSMESIEGGGKKSWTQWLILAVAGTSVFFFAFVIYRRVPIWRANRSERRTRYFKSESYAFKQVLHFAKNPDSKEHANAVYHWLDTLPLHSPTLEAAFNQGNQPPRTLVEMNPSAWRSLRKALDENRASKTSDWINP